MVYNKLTDLKIVMDTGELVGVLTDPIDDALGLRAKGFERSFI